MDKIVLYQKAIIEILEEYAKHKPINMPDVENQVIADLTRNHFQLVGVGWQDDHFVHGCTFHFDIKDGKIWIQANWTDLDVGEMLIEKGVPKSDIVIGFQPPEARPYTGYAVA